MSGRRRFKGPPRLGAAVWTTTATMTVSLQPGHSSHLGQPNTQQGSVDMSNFHLPNLIYVPCRWWRHNKLSLPVPTQTANSLQHSRLPTGSGLPTESKPCRNSRCIALLTSLLVRRRTSCHHRLGCHPLPYYPRYCGGHLTDSSIRQCKAKKKRPWFVRPGPSPLLLRPFSIAMSQS